MEHLHIRFAALFPARMHVDKGSVFAQSAVGLRGDADPNQRGGVLRGDVEATCGDQNVRVSGWRLAVRQAADEPPEPSPWADSGSGISPGLLQHRQRDRFRDVRVRTVVKPRVHLLRRDRFPVEPP